MVSIQYVGNRSYVEYTSKIDGVRYGWTRQRIQHNIPADLVEMFKKDTSKIWVVLDDKPVAQAKEMAKAIEEPVVEEVVVEEPAPEVVEETVEEVAFDPNWTRNEMVKWFKARGESVPRTATKASLTARAEALMNPATEDSSEGEQ
tara:strand:- start:86 stop:523 length:438 start_codon:yes stop_codon:yes gene_type:complete